jgi:glycosyltransferase involved in cell wall biosynthesis
MNKLIILLNLSGSYKGGAQRRYISLFQELQKTRNDYYLLLNKSLYKACMADEILVSDKNVIVLPVMFEYANKIKNNHTIFHHKSKTPNKLRSFLGKYKYFLKQLLSWLRYNVDLYQIVRKYKINTIYGIFTGGVWSWILVRMLQIKFVYSYMDASVSMISKKWINFLSSEYWPLKYAGKVDFLSNDIVKSLRNKIGSFDNERVLITPNSFIDYNRFKPAYPKNPLVSFCSRLTKYKNPDLLIDAIILLKKKNRINFEVAIIGEGILLDSLKEKVKASEIDNITFYGGMSKPEEILAQSSIFVSIQSDNNYPSQSLIEAMACENAIIASDVGETRMLVTENEGILIPLSANSLADAIAFLLENMEECMLLGKNARKKVLREQTIEKFMEYFIEITNN